MSAMLEVRVRTSADAVAAEEGGADRLEVLGVGGLSPEPRVVSEIRRCSNLPVRPMLRLREDFGTDGGEAVRLRGLIFSYLDAGADGLTMGFVNGLGEIDLEVIGALLEDVTCPWTFHRAIDSVWDADKAWLTLVKLPGLDTVATAGSARGVEHGLDALIDRAKADAVAARLIMAAGGLAPEHVPWLVRAGVRTFHISDQVRVRGLLEPSLVQSWRRLLDVELGRTKRR